MSPNNKGIVLVVALLVMALMTLLGSTFLMLALTEHTIARNEYHQAKAFNIAEAGLERARAELSAGQNIIPILVQGGGFDFGSSVAFDGGTYSVRMTNNCSPVNGHSADIAGCASAVGDGDDMAILTSTGTFQNATRTLAVLVEVTPGHHHADTRGWWEVQ